MGKGSNAAKNAVARARADARDAVKPGGGGAEGMKARLGGGSKAQCAICKAEVNGNSRVQLQQHFESKHAKESFEKCWPTWVEPS